MEFRERAITRRRGTDEQEFPQAVEGIGSGLGYVRCEYTMVPPFYIVVHIKSGHEVFSETISSEEGAKLAITRLVALSDWNRDRFEDAFRQLGEESVAWERIGEVLEDVAVLQAKIDREEQGYVALSFDIPGEAPQARLPGFVADLVEQYRTGKFQPSECSMEAWEYREVPFVLGQFADFDRLFSAMCDGPAALSIPGSQFWIVDDGSSKTFECRLNQITSLSRLI